MRDPATVKPLETEPRRPDIGQPRCARCGAAFTCGMKAGAVPCWCAAYPHVMPVPREGAGCYCPACLDELTAGS